eukprot:TRINITY_DN515_c0_g2_i3.p1 TRINITY_DN515_c0_g2~~TRINITY_DN515_c0_g2_i3.p1  ORF type:complete len:507 (+),score=49.73 TRINITY_DN515_c0_g2_i3:41-1561(+)
MSHPRESFLEEFPLHRQQTSLGAKIKKVLTWKPALLPIPPLVFFVWNAVLLVLLIIFFRITFLREFTLFTLPLPLYLVFALFTLDCLFLVSFASKIVTRALQFIYPNQRFIFYTSKMDTSVGVLVWGFLVLSFQKILFAIASSQEEPGWLNKLALCLVVLCVTSFIRRIIVKILIEQVRFRQMSDILLKERCMEKVAQLSEHNNINGASVWSRMYKYVSDGEGKEFKLGLEFESVEDCIERSRKFFVKFSRGDGELDFNEFNLVFGDIDDPKWSQKLFALFKQTKSGVISEDDFVATLIRMHQDQVRLVRNLQNNSDINGVLSLITRPLFWSVSLGICLGIFEVPVVDLLLPFGTFFLGTAFIFGSTLATCFESLMFLLVENPYNVGDCVLIDGERHYIRRIHLLTSEAYTTDGRFVIINHAKISGDHVTNITRSTDWVFTLLMQVNVNVPKEKILEMKRGFLEYCTNHSKVILHSGCSMRVDSIANENQLFLNFWAPLKLSLIHI